MPAVPRKSKARAPWAPANPIAARLELITGRSPTIEYHPDHITRPSQFPDEETRRWWYEQVRDRLLEHWRTTGRRPWAVGFYEPELEEPGGAR